MFKKRIQIYIIANPPIELSATFIEGIRKVQLLLESKGFKVYNPYLEMQTGNFSSGFTAKLQNLMKSRAVYVMPDVSLRKGESTELSIAIDLDLLIINGLIANIISGDL